MALGQAHGRSADGPPAEGRPPLLLALDTATSTASLALYDGERVLAETTWLAGREHSSRLLLEVDRALDRVGRAPASLTGLVVARGPGSFTGVRVGLSVAKGIAAALDLPLWGMGTLDVLAAAVEVVDRPVRPLVDAGRNRVATALYVEGRCVEPARGVSLPELERLLQEQVVVIGDVPAGLRRQLEGEGPARLVSAAGSLRRAGYLAELGWRAAQAGEPGDAAAVDAVYLAR